jgi:hypothetical protein
MNSRTAGMIALPVTILAVLYAAGSALAGWEPSLGWLVQAVIHVGELLAVLALALSGAAGTSRTARVGLGAAVLGQAVLAAAEVVWPADPGLGDTLFGIAPILTGVGLIVAGIAVLRAGRWTGWRRFTPVVLGVYIFVVMTPVLIASGGPPAPASLWAITGWDVLWTLIATSVLTSAPLANPATAGARSAGAPQRTI